MGCDWRYHTNEVQVSDVEHVKRVLNMAAEDGWELVTIIALPSVTKTGGTGMVVWRRRHADVAP